MKIKRIITHPQTCDMGSGYGKFEFDESITLKDFFEYYKKSGKSWGTITIKRNDEILRLFDYDTYNNDIFYYHLGWELSIKIKEITFDYCFMNENIEIILESRR